MNITQLKAMKQVKAVRVNNNFQSNEDIIKEFENQCTLEGYKILDKKLDENTCRLEYTLFNPNVLDTKSIYIGKDNINNKEYIQKTLDAITPEVIISYHVDEYAHLRLELKGRKIYYSVKLNKEHELKEQEGVLTFRSKDYIFSYNDSNNKSHNIYGDIPKANQLIDNKIMITDYGANTEYLLKI